ncbi:MAG: hypothetical protein NTZ11_06920 [Gammaproteobacteria bacterium]|nr:hypothetical protein [Gammaproteobacteria bacterium]
MIEVPSVDRTRILSAGQFAADKKAAKQPEKVKEIGSPATRDRVLETLFAREYIDRVKVEKAEFVRTTPRERDLCRHAPPKVVSVDRTASPESELSHVQTLPITEARAKWQAIVDAQTASATTIVERLSQQINTTPARAGDPNFSGVKPTAKMVALAKKLAAEKGIKKLPPKVLSDSAECRIFIESHRGAPTSRGAEVAPGGAPEGARKKPQ